MEISSIWSQVDPTDDAEETESDIIVRNQIRGGDEDRR